MTARNYGWNIKTDGGGGDDFLIHSLGGAG